MFTTMLAVGFAFLEIASWLGALVAPPLLARWFWIKAPTRLGQWMLPLLFAPCLIVSEWLLVSLILFAAHDDGDGPPGLGLALIPQFLLLLATMSAYYLGIAIVAVRSMWGKSNGS